MMGAISVILSILIAWNDGNGVSSLSLNCERDSDQGLYRICSYEQNEIICIIHPPVLRRRKSLSISILSTFH
ncbi:hypothetical protein EDD22DRAFT_868749 [Suillus occidentalis]|nr:hypothetical protein EDD22DRAFT_868749 [Suillus occidentalis]